MSDIEATVDALLAVAPRFGAISAASERSEEDESTLAEAVEELEELADLIEGFEDDVMDGAARSREWAVLDSRKRDLEALSERVGKGVESLRKAEATLPLELFVKAGEEADAAEARKKLAEVVKTEQPSRDGIVAADANAAEALKAADSLHEEVTKLLGEAAKTRKSVRDSVKSVLDTSLAAWVQRVTDAPDDKPAAKALEAVNGALKDLADLDAS